MAKLVYGSREWWNWKCRFQKPPEMEDSTPYFPSFDLVRDIPVVDRVPWLYAVFGGAYPHHDFVYFYRSTRLFGRDQLRSLIRETRETHNFCPLLHDKMDQLFRRNPTYTLQVYPIAKLEGDNKCLEQLARHCQGVTNPDVLREVAASFYDTSRELLGDWCAGVDPKPTILYEHLFRPLPRVGEEGSEEGSRE